MKEQRVQKDQIKLKRKNYKEMTLFKINIVYKVIIFKTEYYWRGWESIEQQTLERDP